MKTNLLFFKDAFSSTTYLLVALNFLKTDLLFLKDQFSKIYYFYFSDYSTSRRLIYCFSKTILVFTFTPKTNSSNFAYSSDVFPVFEELLLLGLLNFFKAVLLIFEDPFSLYIDSKD